jgi:hypothetical protein
MIGGVLLQPYHYTQMSQSWKSAGLPESESSKIGRRRSWKKTKRIPSVRKSHVARWKSKRESHHHRIVPRVGNGISF